MFYFSKEEQRKRIMALVRKKTGIDCPTLEVQDIWKTMGPKVTVFYWCRKEDVGEHEHLKHLDLNDEEAESIGINRNSRGGPETRGPSRGG
jgi:hypothetical protein